MTFVDHIILCSRTKHPYKSTVMKLYFIMELEINLFWESLRWFNTLGRAPIFWVDFLHKISMWLLKIGLLPLVIPSIFTLLLLLKTKLLKAKVSFSIYQHLLSKWHLSTFITIYFSSKHFETKSKLKRNTCFIFSRLWPEAYKVLPSA